MPTCRPRPAPTLVAVVALSALGLTACGESRIETSEVEGTISKQFQAQGVALTEVDCKDGVKAEAGARISCTALNPSQTKLILEGKVTAIKDEKGSFQVKAVRGIAKGPVIANQALSVYEKESGEDAGTLTCPAEVPIPTTPSVTCALTAEDGERRDAAVTIDARSTLTIEVADGAKE